MEPKVTKPIICIVGPTASGKSELAQCVAERIDGEVVSADSMQIYTGMNIGTGKVTASEQRVPHWGIDLVNPGTAYSAALFQSYSRNVFCDIDSRDKRVVLCGGTGFYVRAAIDDYDFPSGEQVDNPIREKYNAYAHEHGAQALWELLSQADAQSAEVIPANDVKRVVRAFELLEEGTTYAAQKEKLTEIKQLYPSVFIGLQVSPDVLRARIDKRVDAMFEMGLVAEVESLLNLGFREGLTSVQAIGYKETVEALEGRCTLDEARNQIKISTHRYAKRQRTWFRKDQRINWLNADNLDYERLTNEALTIIEASKCES